MMKPKCEDCRYWDDRHCRRYPPNRAVYDGAGRLLINWVSWPKTGSEDWCGEFKEREVPSA